MAPKNRRHSAKGAAHKPPQKPPQPKPQKGAPTSPKPPSKTPPLKASPGPSEATSAASTDVLVSESRRAAEATLLTTALQGRDQAEARVAELERRLAAAEATAATATAAEPAEAQPSESRVTSVEHVRARAVEAENEVDAAKDAAASALIAAQQSEAREHVERSRAEAAEARAAAAEERAARSAREADTERQRAELAQARVLELEQLSLWRTDNIRTRPANAANQHTSAQTRGATHAWDCGCAPAPSYRCPATLRRTARTLDDWRRRGRGRSKLSRGWRPRSRRP